jgi:hypothetical protein
MVTHNPELTRYAQRVLYMRDGQLVGDEQTAIGDMARGARKTFFNKNKLTDEEVAAGVSALMHVIPDKSKVPARKKAKKPAKRHRAKKAKVRV